MYSVLLKYLQSEHVVIKLEMNQEKLVLCIFGFIDSEYLQKVEGYWQCRIMDAGAWGSMYWKNNLEALRPWWDPLQWWAGPGTLGLQLQ